MRWLNCFILCLLYGCKSQPVLPSEDSLIGLPKVTNIRPDFPDDKAVLHVQAETTYMRFDADLSEAWALLSEEGIDPQQIKLMAGNGVRVGTMDAAAVSQFYAKLSNTGGTKVQKIGVGREPVIFETTPTYERSFEVEALLGFDRDETIRLPAGRTQLLLDVVIDGEKVTMGVTPHHHWTSPSIRPKSPSEKAMEGTMFKEIAFDVNLTGDRYLVLSLIVPEELIKKKPPAAALVPAAAEPAPSSPAASGTAGQDRPENKMPEPAPVTPELRPRKPRFGDLLFKGQRADRPLQLICIIRVPPQGEILGDEPARPER